ncbi:hypothetical protein [Stenotrophomonas sp. 364]|uniref:hypothetical protein n=1 Tax=Stenotrophomonas sp. 364 TaxID=2691571 RepID=UPI0013162605|nr:hypothetical protein [Stenotrophomonas sp. 364]QHB72933.1 hypothetical protein GQ674_17270 [Stenotrophomonas sp. 364]
MSMLVGYGVPTDIIPTVEGGLAFNLPALVDGRPARAARIVAGAGGATIRLDWPQASNIRVVAVLGLTCAAGTLISVRGRRAGEGGYTVALGGNTAGQRVEQLPDGSRAAWFVLEAENPSLIGLALHIDAAELDIGEVLVMRALDLAHEVEWSMERIDPSLAERTIGGGLNTVQRRGYRVLRARFAPAPLAQVRGRGLAGNMDLDTLACTVTASGPVVAIPRWSTPEGGIDTMELHRTALYGIALPGPITHQGGNYYGSDWIFEEVPPI